MEWSKAKSILIVLLAVVDIFLFGMYVFRTEKAKNEELTLRNEVCRVLRKQGISVDEEMIPKDSMEILPATIGVFGDCREIATKLLGKVSESFEAEYTTYSGEKGTFMFAKDSFSLVYESGKQILSEEKAKELAAEIAAALPIKTSEKGPECTKKDGSFVIKFSQIFSGMELFDCDVEIKISESGSVIAHGNYLCEGEISTYSDDVRPPSAIMLAFADAVKGQNLSDVTVEDISIGYTAKASDRERLSLAPTLGIRTNCGMFLVDMQTERVYIE